MNAELESLVEMTRQVAELTEKGEWAEAGKLDAERQVRLRSLCAMLKPGATSPDVIAALSEVLKLNDTLIGAVCHQQRTVVRQLDTVKVGRQAVAAYNTVR